MIGRAVRFAGIAAAVACTAATPAAAQEGGSDGAPFEVRGISAVAPLRSDNGSRALGVYKRLIPRGMAVPAEPAVAVWLSELAAFRNGGRPQDDASHWMEGAIQLRVKAGRFTGWYPIHYPVNAQFWHGAGRFVGLPKRHASATMEPAGAGWRAQATPCEGGGGAFNECLPQGGPTMQLEWQPGATDASTARAAFRVPTDPLLVLNKPLEGPELRRVQYRLAPGNPLQTSLPGAPPAYNAAKPDVGLVRLRLRDDVDAVQEQDLPKIFPAGTRLSDMIDTDQVVPGAHGHFSALLTSEDETIGRGGYGRAGTPGGTAGPRQQSTPRRCVKRRAVTVRLRTYRRARVRGVRARAGGRRLRARMISRRRAKVSLGRLRKPGVYRVTVTAIQSRGLRPKTTRRYRLCKRAARR